MIVGGPREIQRLGLTVDEFCAAVPMSRVSYYRMRKANKGPPECRVGGASGRTIIRRQDAEEWLLTLREDLRTSSKHNQQDEPIAHSPEPIELFT